MKCWSTEYKFAISCVQERCSRGKDRGLKDSGVKGSLVTSVSQALLLSQLPVHLPALLSESRFSFPRYVARWRPCGSGPKRQWFELSKLLQVTNKAALRSRAPVLAFHPRTNPIPNLDPVWQATKIPRARLRFACVATQRLECNKMIGTYDMDVVTVN